MTTHTEIVRQREVEHERRWPSPVTGPALVLRHTQAVEAVIAYRAAVKRDVATGASRAVVGISFFHYRAAVRALIATRRAVDETDQITRIAAYDAELSVCEESAGGDNFMEAARDHLWRRVVERYADLMLPGADRVRAVAAE